MREKEIEREREREGVGNASIGKSSFGREINALRTHSQDESWKDKYSKTTDYLREIAKHTRKRKERAGKQGKGKSEVASQEKESNMARHETNSFGDHYSK